MKPPNHAIVGRLSLLHYGDDIVGERRDLRMAPHAPQEPYQYKRQSMVPLERIFFWKSTPSHDLNNDHTMRSSSDNDGTGPQDLSALSSVTWLDTTLNALQDIIGADTGKRGMKSLIVPRDFGEACKALGRLSLTDENKAVVILSGFPCHVGYFPPTETDGPGGSVAIAKAAIGLGHNAIIVTDECNEAVFAAAMMSLPKLTCNTIGVCLEVFPTTPPTTQDKQRILKLVATCGLLIACERAGPSSDGNCYTMRGINMTECGLIAPLISSLVDQRRCKFIGIGDGGNEMGMGKVLDIVKSTILNGEQIACVVAADCLVSASVSNWGGYALAAGAATVRAHDELTNMLRQYPFQQQQQSDGSDNIEAQDILRNWIDKCVPTEAEERALLERCVAAGSRDGVTGKLEPTVDGLPMSESIKCLKDIRTKVLWATYNRLFRWV